MKTVAESLKIFCDKIKAKGFEGTVTYRGELSHLVRCGCDVISLNTSEYTRRIQIDIQYEGRAVSGSIVYMPGNDEAVEAMIESLAERLPHMPVSEHLPEVEPLVAGDLPEGEMVSDFDSAAAVSVFENTVNEFSGQCEVSGACSGGVSEYAVMNTASVEPVGDRVRDFSLEVVLFIKDGSGRELRTADCGNRFKIDAGKIISELSHALHLKKTTPREDLEPAEYDVVFSADALARMLSFLGWVLFSGEAYDLGTSMHDKEAGEDIGSKMAGDNITIIDNPLDVDALYPRRFGINGMPRVHFEMLNHGYQKHFYFSNRKLASRFGRKINGDQSCSSLFLKPGDGPADFGELVVTTDKPVIYVSHLHYMNLTNSTTGEFTASSRFGTFLLENGEVKSHLYNLRVNDSLKRIFNNVEWLSSALKQVDLSDTYFLRNPTGVTCPALAKVTGVKITATSAR